MKKPKIVVIGGGTGSFVVLSGLKHYPVQLSAIVAMTDSGGSTGRLIDQLGVLPPGDLRQALVALSESEAIWRKLFAYRFDSGDLKGHNFGNIFISALEKLTGSLERAVHFGTEILETRGKVIPVTLENTTLCAQYSDGTRLMGEALIDKGKKNGASLKKLYIKPAVKANVAATLAIRKADYIIFSPGDLYTSLLPNVLVDGVAKAIRRSRAKKVVLINLMTKFGQTDGFTANDFIKELSLYLGKLRFDYILMNSKKPDPDLLRLYRAKDRSNSVIDDLEDTLYPKTKIIRADMLSRIKVAQSKQDKVKRSLIRHDPDKVARALMRVVWR